MHHVTSKDGTSIAHEQSGQGPALVIDGGTTPWLSHAADALASVLPRARRQTIAGQPHNVADEALAPVLTSFFKG